MLDDLQPCDLDDGQAVIIPHQVQDASVEIAGEDSFPWLLVVIAGVAAVVIVAGGGAWLLLSRRNPAQTPQ